MRIVRFGTPWRNRRCFAGYTAGPAWRLLRGMTLSLLTFGWLDEFASPRRSGSFNFRPKASYIVRFFHPSVDVNEAFYQFFPGEVAEIVLRDDLGHFVLCHLQNRLGLSFRPIRDFSGCAKTSIRGFSGHPCSDHFRDRSPLPVAGETLRENRPVSFCQHRGPWPSAGIGAGLPLLPPRGATDFRIKISWHTACLSPVLW
jgi:hypothetical protein